MTTPIVWLLFAGRVALYIALVWLILWLFRWIRMRSPILGLILAIGIVVRAVVGSLLFAISYFELPFLTGLQLGGGFWTLALDARSYFQAAARAAHLGISTIPGSSASPAFVRLLALWMELFGVSPASAVLLNLVCYVLIAALIVAASRAVVSAAIPLGAVTFSPALIIFGTQALKDSVCVALVVVAIAGGRVWVRALTGSATSPLRDLALGATCLSAAVFGFAGIRAYVAVFIIVSVLAMAFASIAIASGREKRLKTFISYAALLPLLWVAFVKGAGPYYSYYDSVVSAAMGNPMRAAVELDQARAGFVATGGATSVVESSASDDIAPLPLDFENITSTSLVARAARTLRGGAVMLAPISVLRALSIVSFSGGRGLLVITDIDTLVLDAAIVASLVVLFGARGPRESMPVLLFALVLAALTAVTMAYVVTNFGTLFRLRLLAVTPIWVIPAFVGSSRLTPNESE